MQVHRHDEHNQRYWPPISVFILSSLVVAWIVTMSLSSNSIPSSSSSAGTSKKEVFHTTGEAPLLKYELVENGSMTNTYGDDCKFLRYTAQEKQGSDGTYKPVSVHTWATLLAGKSNTSNNGSNKYIHDFIKILQTSKLDAYFFETKGVAEATARDTPFEFVLVESSYLYQFADKKHDPDTFGKHLKCHGDKDGCVFSNLRGDSLLIAPKQVDRSAQNIYGHLAAFSQRAPIHQQMHVWQLVLETYVKRIQSVKPEKVWLSTDGTGVAWLHIRLDPQPKYYDYQPFANPARVLG